MTLFCDVMRNLYCEIHTSECKDVIRARAKGFMCGTVEGNTVEQAITNHISISAGVGIELTRDCYRIMPCVKGGAR